MFGKAIGRHLCGHGIDQEHLTNFDLMEGIAQVVVCTGQAEEPAA